MEVKLENVGPCRKILRINTSDEAIASEYETIVKLYAKSSKVPGFRPGKAPVNVIERYYIKGIIEQLKERLIPKFYHEALRQEGIQAVAILNVSDVVFKKEKGITFNVMIDVAPEFKLPKHKKIPLKQNRIDVSDKEIDEALGGLL